MTNTPKGSMMKRHHKNPIKLYRRSRNSPATSVFIFLLTIFMIIIFRILVKIFCLFEIKI